MLISTFQGDGRDGLLRSSENEAFSDFMLSIIITHFYTIIPFFYWIFQSYVSWFSLTSLKKILASTLKEELRSQLH